MLKLRPSDEFWKFVYIIMGAWTSFSLLEFHALSAAQAAGCALWASLCWACAGAPAVVAAKLVTCPSLAGCPHNTLRAELMCARGKGPRLQDGLTLALKLCDIAHIEPN